MDELQAGIKIGWRNIKNLRYVVDTTLMEKSEEELKSLLMTVKEENDRDSLRLNIKTNKQKNERRSWHLAPLFHANRRGEIGRSDRFPLHGL